MGISKRELKDPRKDLVVAKSDGRNLKKRIESPISEEDLMKSMDKESQKEN